MIATPCADTRALHNRILLGDALAVLAGLPDNFVQTCITSPPYYGLRAYGTPPVVWDAGEGCAHEWATHVRHADHGGDGARGSTLGGGTATQAGTRFDQVTARCRLCGGWRGSLGWEETPDLFVAHLVQIFAQVRRVLRPDGTCWIVIGDSYAGSWGNYVPGGLKGEQREHHEGGERWERRAYQDSTVLPAGAKSRMLGAGIKDKDLLLIPYLLAAALRGDGWYLRQMLVWDKKNVTPESVTDRLTTAHEYVLLLAKSPRYYFDYVAIQEPSLSPNDNRKARAKADHKRMPSALVQGMRPGSATYPMRRRRSVLHVATVPYGAAHFATFPPKLIEPFVLAGSSPKACECCGAPWVRITLRGVPTFEAGTPDPTPHVGRHGLARARQAKSEQRALVLPQAQIAARLAEAAAGREEEMRARYGSKWDHWVRTDTSGARVPTRADWRDLCLVLPGLPDAIEAEAGSTDAPPMGDWRPTCACPHNEDTGRSLVLDPFFGSGTTGQVAVQHGRDYLGIELGNQYLPLIEERLARVQPDIWTTHGEVAL